MTDSRITLVTVNFKKMKDKNILRAPQIFLWNISGKESYLFKKRENAVGEISHNTLKVLRVWHTMSKITSETNLRERILSTVKTL